MISRSPSQSFDDVLELMSTEHQRLSETIGRIRSAIVSQDLPVIRLELVRLQSSEELHFHREEQMMEHYDYPDGVNHKNTHKAMLEALKNINRSIFAEKLHNISDDLGKYLEKSVGQISAHDNHLRDFVLELKKGAG